MRLEELCQGYGKLIAPEEAGNLEVSQVTHDSRKIHAGGIFVAIRGENNDGHQYISGACQVGAKCIVTENPDEVDFDIPILHVPDTRKAMALLARRLYDYPDTKLRVIGVTGTNGKTTCTFILSYLLPALDCGRTGRMGTVSYYNGMSEEKASRTTPESPDMFQSLAEMVKNGCRYAAIEVSSHGLWLDRVYTLELKYAVFTNLTRDHLDFHGTMEAYFEAKQKQFDLLAPNGVAILNWDDEYGRRIHVPDRARILRYGEHPDAELRFEVNQVSGEGSQFTLNYEGVTREFFIPLLGRHNIYNCVASLAVLLCEGITMDRLVDACKGLKAVPGRMELITRDQDFQVAVDYAHTPDALMKVLACCKETNPGRLVIVFGAGGDRDHGKRRDMGEAAHASADVIILTSDNPRHEDPETIMNMVAEGIDRPAGPTFQRIADRRLAIQTALEQALPGDLIIVAGKGHETTQQVGDTYHPFNDRDVICDLLNT